MSATPATQNDGGCEFVPRLPRMCVCVGVLLCATPATQRCVCVLVLCVVCVLCVCGVCVCVGVLLCVVVCVCVVCV